MKKILLLLLIFSFLPLLPGCLWENKAKDDTALIGDSIEKFEYAINIQENFDGNSEEATEEVLDITYDEPDNQFWQFSLWTGVKKYSFLDWDISINEEKAHVSLDYEITIGKEDGDEVNDNTVEFKMRKFSEEWKVNLSDFTELD